MILGPEFAKLWAGQSISRLGSQITVFALPTFAVLVLHASAPQIGTLTALEFLPFPVLGLFAGVWVDRMPRRRVMIAADVVRTIALGSIPLAGFLGSVEIVQLYLVAVVAGSASVFFDVAYQSYLPAIVGKDQLTNANARLEFSNSAAQIAGNAAGGLLIGTIGAVKAIALDAFSYIISVVSLLLIRAEEAPAAHSRPARGAFFMELAEGLQVVWHNRNLRQIGLCTAISNFGGSIVVAVEFIFFYRNLGLTPGALGVVLGVANVGFIGALLAGRAAKVLGIKRTLVISMALSTLATACIPLAQYAAPLLITFLTTAAQAISIPIYNITQVSWRQGAVPEYLQGRMNATMRTFVWGTLPLGAVIGGILGSAVGIVPAIFIGAALCGVAALALIPLRFGLLVE